MKKTIIGSISGGRTSEFMAHWMLENWSNKYNLHFVFANTGLEHEKTLEFVDKCDQEWGLNLTWIEAVTHKEFGRGQTYRVVDFNSASRNGEPFEQLTEIEGMAGPGTPICTTRLKSRPIRKFKNSIDKNAFMAIGIRLDEIDRMNPDAKKERLIYPLISMRPTRKGEILDWFKNHPFDLEIPEHLGNCVTCWKKTDRKLYTIAKHEPERYDFFERMEKLHCLTNARDGERRYWFRKHRTVNDIINLSKKPFKEFVEFNQGYQLDLLDLDSFSGCSESCEAF